MSQPIVTPICLMCKHFVGGISSPSGAPSCKAFPGRIPDVIWRNDHDHREPLGNETTLFELADDVTEDELLMWEQLRLEYERDVARRRFERLLDEEE